MEWVQKSSIELSLIKINDRETHLEELQRFSTNSFCLQLLATGFTSCYNSDTTGFIAHCWWCDWRWRESEKWAWPTLRMKQIENEHWESAIKKKDVPGAGASAFFASAAWTENDWIKKTAIFDERVKTRNKSYLSFLGRLKIEAEGKMMSTAICNLLTN